MAWGLNGSGQLGDGTTGQRSTPTPIGTHSDWSIISAGTQQTLAIKSDSTLWAWGGNDYGQLGDFWTLEPRDIGLSLLTKHTVTPSAGANGSISPATAQTVNANSATSFVIFPDINYEIASVTGCDGSLAGDFYTTGPVTADCTVSATFQLIQYNLGVTLSGAGTVNTTPGTDLACTGGCAQSYDIGTVLSLTATPDTNYLFAGWGGDCSGTEPCVLTMDASKSVTATFTGLAAGTPASVTAPSTSTTGGFMVTWERSTTPNAIYLLEGQKDGGGWSPLAPETAERSIYVSGLANGSWFFRVTAKATGLPDSTPALSSGTTVTLTCGTINTLSVPTTNDNGSYAIRWGTSSTEGVTYKLYEGAALIYNSTGQYAYVSGKPAGTYNYSIKAVKSGYVDSAVTGPFSVTVTAAAATVKAPNIIKVPATDADGKFAVRWGYSNTSGVVYILRVNGGPEINTGTGRYYWSNGLPSGTHTFSVIARKGGVDSLPTVGTTMVP